MWSARRRSLHAGRVRSPGKEMIVASTWTVGRDFKNAHMAKIRVIYFGYAGTFIFIKFFRPVAGGT